MDNSSNTLESKNEQTKALLFKKMLGHYYVKHDGRILTCSVSSKIHKAISYKAAYSDCSKQRVATAIETKDDPLAIGDEVLLERVNGDTAVIVDVLPRRSKFSRRATGPVPIEQIIAANLDQVVILIAAASPPPQWHLLDRYLVDAEAASIPALICITKMDLADEASIRQDLALYDSLGYPVVFTSVESKLGLDETKEALRNRFSVFVGKSGVGKTTLLNAIQPDLGLRTNAISSSTGKGKHTTTHMEMFDLRLDGDERVTGYIADTPGVKSIAVWGIEDMDTASLFPEMRPYIGLCRFGERCTHSHEPQCAIKDAVEAGRISQQRYQSYLRLSETGMTKLRSKPLISRQ